MIITEKRIHGYSTMSLISLKTLRALMSRSHARYTAGISLLVMIRADLIAERIAIDSYQHALRYLSD